ncbi:rhamnan synthesis F family protein [Uliginosibacterium sp. TH139]|uniref:rhamnan synthesis F family protein n=1 Tax=Uliginosibacterium sp. TH139 TaxID=2067453 RepID=UPI001304511C|nr:rhamnan synthesis F family protein [Uliginosibacterium sp. TH139]
MLKNAIRIILMWCGLYKRPAYLGNKIIFSERAFGRVNRLDFDRNFYLECYDDVRQSGRDPVLHYLDFGRHEGRVGMPFAPEIDLTKIDRSMEAVLLVTHELSATGAPILAYNIAKELCAKYNVLIVSLGNGCLLDEFLKLGVHMFCEPGLRRSEPMSKFLIDKLNDSIRIKFAIVNSIESASVLPGLYSLDIPTVSLLHEFPSYSGGLDRFRRCIYWSGTVLLSSELARTDLLKSGQISNSDKIFVLPQGKCLVPSYGANNTESRPALKSRGVIRIIGAGTITYRKGVDLFIECARTIRERLPGRALEFAWVGKNVDSSIGADYFQYLEDQIERSRLTQCFSFIDEADNYEELLGSADVFLMTSRLDPLPNVAIDAFAKNVPVFFFRDACGLTSLISAAGQGGFLCAEYLSPSDMASKVVRFILDEGKGDKLAEVKRIYEEHFRFDAYFKKLETYASETIEKHLQFNRDADFIRSKSAINESFCDPRAWELFGPEDKAKRYVNMWRSNIYQYRPVPEFHPSVYRDAVNPECDPYVHYLKSGMPSGAWKSELVDVTTDPKSVSELSVAIHIHCYYPDLLGEVLRRLAVNHSNVDIYVSTDTEEKKNAISLVFDEFHLAPSSIDIAPNVGRDIGPFLNMYCRNLSDGYDVIFHVHTKKSPHVNEDDGRNWYEYCLENLLGGVGGRVLDKILFDFQDKSLGLVFPSDPNSLGWGKNLKYAANILGRLGYSAPEGEFNFPIGTMFAASRQVIRSLSELNFSWDEYPSEPLPIDGTMLHAIERVIPFISEGLGLRQKLVYVDKTTRV